MATTKLRVAIYARVSTIEGQQTPENQLRQLRLYAKARGFTITAEYVDCATGRNERRPQYQKLLDAVRKRQADIVLSVYTKLIVYFSPKLFMTSSTYVTRCFQLLYAQNSIHSYFINRHNISIRFNSGEYSGR